MQSYDLLKMTKHQIASLLFVSGVQRATFYNGKDLFDGVVQGISREDGSGDKFVITIADHDTYKNVSFFAKTID